MLTRSFSRSKLKDLYTFSPYIHCQIIPYHLDLPSISIYFNKPYLNPAEIPRSSIFYFLLQNFRSFCSIPSHIPPPPLTRDGNFDASNNLPVCPGCGIYLQDSDPKRPGFFITPSYKGPDYKFRMKRFLVEVPEIPPSRLKDLILSPESETGARKPRVVGYTDPPQKPLVCMRCHSLRYYGKVKDPTLEDMLPRFDFDRTVATRLATADAPPTVALLVVDASDFDGSFPKHIAKVVTDTIVKNKTARLRGLPSNAPRIVLVVTKIDLLPVSLSPMKFEDWVRRRAKAGGAGHIHSLHLVSPTRNWGLFNLVDAICGIVGERGHVWAVGAQNAGKSTLLNKISKVLEKRDLNLTEARIPGTTLGIMRFDDILPGRSKLFDTPGFLSSSQITSRLTFEEQKLVHICKRMKPRTYRIMEGHSITIGGLMRVDIEDLSVTSLYVTVWSSPLIPLHMGRIENANNLKEKHFGRRLQPPSGAYRVLEMGKWERQEFLVRGDNWDRSSTDIAAAGLGWVAFGLKGEAVVGVWTYQGIELTKRDSLLSERARLFKEIGFAWTPVFQEACRNESIGLWNRNKVEEKKKRKKKKLELEEPGVPAAAAAVDPAVYLPPLDLREIHHKEKMKLPKERKVDYIEPLVGKPAPQIDAPVVKLPQITAGGEYFDE